MVAVEVDNMGTLAAASPRLCLAGGGGNRFPVKEQVPEEAAGRRPTFVAAGSIDKRRCPCNDDRCTAEETRLAQAGGTAIAARMPVLRDDQRCRWRLDAEARSRGTSVNPSR